MSLSKTSIANRALIKVGEPRTSNIATEDTVASNIIIEIWSSVRDSLLAQYPWNFAIERKALTADATAPLFEYTNRYLLPTGS